MCAGCGSCAEICNRNAISIELNSDGFYQCIVEEENCVDCGACMTVCPIINKPEKQMIDALELHSLVSKDPVVLKQSSSGGAGFELAKTLISKGYLVCGVSYDSEREQAKHRCMKDIIIQNIINYGSQSHGITSVWIRIAGHFAKEIKS